MDEQDRRAARMCARAQSGDPTAPHTWQAMESEQKIESGAESKRVLESILVTSGRLTEEMNALSLKAQKLAGEHAALAQAHADLFAGSTQQREAIRVKGVPAAPPVKRAPQIEGTRESMQDREDRRVEVDQERSTAEQSRIAGELKRIGNETDRQSSEKLRALAESIRQEFETLRKSAEIARAFAEQARRAAEEARDAADQARASEMNAGRSAERAASSISRQND